MVDVNVAIGGVVCVVMVDVSVATCVVALLVSPVPHRTRAQIQTRIAVSPLVDSPLFILLSQATYCSKNTDVSFNPLF